MINLNSEDSPGCFGSPTAHCSSSFECQSCAFSADCGGKAEEMLDVLEKEFRLTDLRRKRSRVQPPSLPVRSSVDPAPSAPRLKPETESVPGLPKKSAKLVQSIEKTGVDLRGELVARRNPFVDLKPAFMGVVCEVLLQGAFTKAELKRAFLKNPSWKDGTASAHVSLVLPALLHLGVIVGEGKSFTLKETA